MKHKKGSSTGATIVSTNWWHYIIPSAFLTILTALFYYPSLHYEFQFDDIANINKSFSIRHNTLWTLFFSGTRWISYWLNAIYYSIGKFDPFSYRVGNIIIHISNGLLVFFLINLLLKNLKKESFFKSHALSLSFFTALLFLLHPVQTQTVSYVIQGQLEGLAAFFTLSIALCFAWVNKTSGINKIALILLVLFLAFLSCGTKEICIMTPILIMLIDWFFIAQGESKSFYSRLWLHITLTVMIVSIYLWFLKPAFFTEILGLQKIAANNIGNIITEEPKQIITPWMFFRSQFKVILHYLGIFLWPFNISVEYDWVLSKGFFAHDCIFPFLLLVLIFFGIGKLLWNNRIHTVGFAALWFFICIAPRSSIIPSPELLVDYKTYLASVGWLFILASCLVYLYTKIVQSYSSLPKSFLQPSAQTLVIALLFATPLGYTTLKRNTIWRSGLEFWANMIENAPGKARAYNNYGVELSQQRKFDESITYFEKAIAMDAYYPDPLNNIAVAYANIQELDKAIAALLKSIALNRHYPEGYNNLASFYIQKKEFDIAERALAEALRLRSHYGKAHFNLGRIYLEKSENEKAWECFRKACMEGDFDVDHGFATYGRVSMNLAKYDHAIIGYSKCLELTPGYPEAEFNLANAYYMKQDFVKAQKLYQNLVNKNPNDAKSLYNLAETYYSTRDFTKALAMFKDLAPRRMEFPQAILRIAGCYEQLGNKETAIVTLKQFNQEFAQISGPGIDNIKGVVQQYLNQMEFKSA